MRLQKSAMFFFGLGIAMLAMACIALVKNQAALFFSSFTFAAFTLLALSGYILVIRPLHQLYAKTRIFSRYASPKSWQVQEIVALNNYIEYLNKSLNAYKKESEQHLKDYDTVVTKFEKQLEDEQKKNKKLGEQDKQVHIDDKHVAKLISPNLALLNEQVNLQLKANLISSQPFAAMLLEVSSKEHLPYFLNDRLIKQIAQRLMDKIEARIIVKRDGSNDFFILLPYSDEQRMKQLAQHILYLFDQPFFASDKALFLSVHAGIGVFPQDGQCLENIIASLEAALSKAKTGAPRSFYFVNPRWNGERKIQPAHQLLKHAWNINDFAVYYQPRYRLKEKHITVVEALLRWHHPDLGLLPASEFISVLEERGLIHEIGDWARHKACHTVKKLQESIKDQLSVSFTLSSVEFFHPHICHTISNLIRETGLAPEQIELQIKEQTLLQNSNLAMSIMRNLKNLGVFLCLNHFGEGHSSLPLLAQLPLSSIKIAAYYISELPIKRAAQMVQASIHMAHDFGLEVIAEHIETKEQLETIMRFHCDLVQGYYLSHPQPEDKLRLQFATMSML